MCASATLPSSPVAFQSTDKEAQHGQKHTISDSNALLGSDNACTLDSPALTARQSSIIGTDTVGALRILQP